MRPQGTGWIPDRRDPRDYGPGHENLRPALKDRSLQEGIVAPPAALPPRVDLREFFPPGVPAHGHAGPARVRCALDTAGPGEIPLPGPFDTRTALHAIVAVGYDDAKPVSRIDPFTGRVQSSSGALRIRNSWGARWGEGGYGWLPYDYVLAGLTSDWWCLLRADYLDIDEFRKVAAGGG